MRKQYLNIIKYEFIFLRNQQNKNIFIKIVPANLKITPL